jgi:hypothetical protein
MKIDFNNVRIQALRNYNSLIKKLNESIVEDVDMNRVIIPVGDLERCLDLLRDNLIGIGLSYHETDPDLKCVIDDDTEILTFNPDRM